MSQPVQVQVFRGGQLAGHVVLDGSKKVNKIGKTSSSQIKLDDPQASRVHAVIEVSRTGAWLIDMGSAVGTLLNGARVNKARLGNGDQITIGSTTLVVTIGGELAAPPPMPVVAPQQTQAAPPVVAPPPMAPVAPPAAPPMAAPPMAAPPMAAPPMAAPPMAAPPMAAPPPGQAPAAMESAPMAGPPPSSLGPLQPSAQPAPRPAAFGPPTPMGTPSVRDTDGTLSDTDPAVMRLQKSARRNRMIGGGVIVGVVVVTAAFVYLGKQGEGPPVIEPSNYSGFGVKAGAADAAAADDAAADDAAADAAAPDDAAADDAAADDAAADDAGADDAAADDAAGDDAAGDDAAGDDAAGDDAAPGAAFDAAAARDEASYVYEKLTTEQTFAALAQRFYADAGRVTLLTEANPLASADRPLAAGTEVRVPRFVIHEVAPGNTLGGIAKIYLGDGKLYEKIFSANRDVLASPTAIDVGMKLKIPILQE